VSTSISIPTPLRAYAGGERQVAVEGRTVADALGDLTARYAQLRRHLYSDNGELRRFVNVYLNDANVRDLDGIGTPLGDGDRLTIVPSIAGG
jgi:molybdopterin synthase sulfur carrier subunit